MRLCVQNVILKFGGATATSRSGCTSPRVPNATTRRRRPACAIARKLAPRENAPRLDRRRVGARRRPIHRLQRAPRGAGGGAAPITRRRPRRAAHAHRRALGEADGAFRRPACGKSKKVTHYPCALSKLLGANFDVRPFGCSKATAHGSGEGVGSAASRSAPRRSRGAAHCRRAFRHERRDARVQARGDGAGGVSTAGHFRPRGHHRRVHKSHLGAGGAPLLPPPQTRHTWAEPPVVGGMALEDWREHHEILVHDVRPACGACRRWSRRGSAAAVLAAVERTGALELLDLSDVLAIDEANFHDGLHPSSAGASRSRRRSPAAAARLGGRTCVSGACCRRLEKD